MSDIDKLRDQIDKITLEMIRLLKERVEVAKQIGSLKNNLGLGVTNEERESQLRTKVISLCKESVKASLEQRSFHFAKT